ncbi:DUF2637 domain-containing protein [Amycolatopsis kentuckyensis]|uniref:DUF2637 domain-containing protein n=1 Tax=Amycolatopsis kentuckyensis TaxID=218823 RepID=UPI003564F202
MITETYIGLMQSSYTSFPGAVADPGPLVEDVDPPGASVDESGAHSRHDSAMTETSTPNHATDADEAEELGWWKTNRIFLIVALLTLLAGAVIVVTQLNFYRDIPGLTIEVVGHKIIVWPLIPIMVEGFTWTFGAMATHAVRTKTGGAGKYIRWMWFFATIAATVNVYHNVRTTHDILTGVVLGGASIAAPFLWHSYVGMTSAIVEHRSVEDVKLAAKRRLQHPRLSWRADRIQTLLMCDRPTAWAYALVFKTSEIHDKVKADLGQRLDETPPQVGAVLAARVVRPNQPAVPKAKAVARPAVKAAPPRRPIAPLAPPKPIEPAPAKVAEPQVDQPSDAPAARDEQPAETTGQLAPVIKINGGPDGVDEQEMTLEAVLAQLQLPEKKAHIVRTFHELEQRGPVRSYAQVDRQAGTNAYAKTVLPGYFDAVGIPNPFATAQASG